MKKPLVLLGLLLLISAMEFSLAHTPSSNNTDSFENIEKILDPDPFIEEIKSDIDELLYKTGRPVDCQRCCSKGTWTDARCCIECNNCQLYSDGGSHECSDFPH